MNLSITALTIFLMLSMFAEAHDCRNGSMILTYHIETIEVKQLCTAAQDGSLTCHFFTHKPQYDVWEEAGVEAYNNEGTKIVDTFRLNNQKVSTRQP